MLLLALMGMPLASLPAQQLIVNGGFESPVVGTTSILGIGLVPGTETFIATNTNIPGFTVTQGVVSLIDTGGTVLGSTLGFLAAPQGNQYAILNGISVNALGVVTAGGTGTLTQLFNTTAGNTYQVSFLYGGVGISGVNGATALQVGVTNSIDSTAPNGGGTLTITANGFQNETFNFIATGASSVLSFDEPNGSVVQADGVGLDNVTVTNEGVTPVPEPAFFAGAAGAFLLLLIAGRSLRRASLVFVETGSLPLTS